MDFSLKKYLIVSGLFSLSQISYPSDLNNKIYCKDKRTYISNNEFYYSHRLDLCDSESKLLFPSKKKSLKSKLEDKFTFEIKKKGRLEIKNKIIIYTYKF